jgi:prepilin-type N-terminal cleavage/methylation domain-containing protein
MTSAARTPDFRSGFTLIEIVMVLAIAAIVTGGAITMMVFSSDERALKNASGEVELLAKRARTISILKQTPYALEFRLGKIRMLPLAQAGADETFTALGNTIGGQEVGAVEPEVFTLPENMAVLLRRWNSDQWLPMRENSVHIWRFDPDGLCEPVSVRFVMEDSWAEDAYHPLTATIADSQLEAR